VQAKSMSFSVDRIDKISGVHVSPGSAETIARGGGITNQHLLAYSLSNILAKITEIGYCALKL